MKNILIPTDFSKNAWNALQYAISLFANDRVTFYLLNAYHAHYFTTDTLLVPENVEVAHEKAKTISEEGLKELMIKLAPYKNENHSFRTLSVYSGTVEAVSEMTRKYKVKLVVMGTMGENDALDKVYGTNAVNVMKKIHRCPVLVIPEHAAYHKSGKKEVVFATNFRDAYKKKSLKYLPEIAKNYSASLRILYIQESEKSLTTEQEENKEWLQEYLKDVSHSFHTLTKIELGAGIHSFIQSRGSHMLAILNKKHNFFNSIFSGSIIEEIGQKPRIPVLVLQDWEDRRRYHSRG